MAKWLMAVPPVIFIGLAGAFYFGMTGTNPNEMPTAFKDRAAPKVPATGLEGIPQLTNDMLNTGEVTVVNFWATWCPPCRAEHPVLMELAAQGVRVAGVNIMDDDTKASAYLAQEGNPFFAVGTDPQGRNRVEWGVTAPPETFILRGDGTVAYRFIGPLIGADYENRFMPELAKAMEANKG